MAKLTKETFKFNGIEWEVFSKDTVFLPFSNEEQKNGELLERIITVHNYN